MSKSGLAIAAALALMAAPAVAHATTPKWLVELDGAPTADGTSRAKLDAEHRRFRAEAREAGVRYQRRYSYSTLFNGVSVSATKPEADELRELAAVKAVHAVQAIPLDVRTEAFSPALSFALTMTGADIAQSRLGYTGRGIHVAVIDSGIDYDHPDLGGCFGAGCRVTNGYDLVGDDYDEEEADPQWQPVPHPDPDPDDCQAHGTHVAGILGANGAIKGVAPDVTFGAYKVFGCIGATSSDVMLAAMERVYRDGADVLNLSIGESLLGWPQSPAAQAASRLVRAGIVVVAAGGNDHLSGLHAMGGPGVGKNVVTAASVDNLVNYRLAFAITPDHRRILYWPGLGPPPAPAGTYEIVRTGTATTPADACAPLPAGSLTGKVALVRRGGCPGIDKGINVAAAGAIAVVVYNDAGPASAPPAVPGVPIPLAFIDQADGEVIDARLAEGPVSLTWGIAAVPSNSAGRLSAFSSEGLTADLTLKPDVAAPGGVIRSTWPVELGSYQVLSGTSMASPHVAGAAALYLQAHRHAPAREVGVALQNTADPVAAATGGAEPVVRQGAGLIDIDDAILATARITPSKLSLRDDPVASRELTIANRSRRAVTYALSTSDAPAVAGRNIFTEHTEAGAATVAFTHRRRPITSVTVPPHGRATIDVRIAPDAGLSEGAVYGGYLVATPGDGSAPLRVVYGGYKGDYAAVPAMTPTTQGYPWLARQTGIALDGLGKLRRTYAKQDAGAVFTLAPRQFGPRSGADIPVALIHLNNFARRIRVDVVLPGSRHSLGEAYRRDYVGRNPVENLLSQPWSLVTELPFDGTVRRGHRQLPLADGDYQLVVTVERPSGASESWTSTVFRIDRPD